LIDVEVKTLCYQCASISNHERCNVFPTPASIYWFQDKQH